MDKVLTFSIASYNASSTLRECLDSFTVSECLDKIEVLIVNDGSTDDTASVAREYEEKYPQTFRLINKENGGHGSTINTGISEARGKYFRPLDADDWIEKDNLPAILSTLERADYDAFVLDYIIFYTFSGQTELKSYSFLKNNSRIDFTTEEWISTFPYHALLFRTQLLRDNKIKLSEKCFYEDSEYTLYPIPFCRSAFYLGVPLYVYRVGSDGQSVSPSSFIKHCAEQEMIIENLFNFYSRNEISDRYFYYEKRIFEVLNFYFKAVMNKAWYSDSSLQKRKKAFLRRLKMLNRRLFAEYVSQTALQRLSYRTGWKLDRILIPLYKKFKGIKENGGCV